ncbi:MAG: metallopeptidase family protein [Kofleriaceae bacterium]
MTSTDERIEQLVEAGMECLEAGDLAGASKALERAKRTAKDHPAVFELEVTIALADGDEDGALALCERAAERSPEDPIPLLTAASIHFHDRGEHAAALSVLGRALELVDEEEDLVAAVTLKADVLLDWGGEANLREAREALAELSTSAIDDPGTLVDIAELWLSADDPARARALADQLLAGDEAKEDAVLRADALHLVGRICDATGDVAGRTAAWREVRALDLAESPPAWHLSEAEFDERARAAIELLSDDAQRLLANVPILVEETPSLELVDSGVDPRLLGLFSGTPMPEISSVGGNPQLTHIHLFQRNIEHAAGDEDDLEEQIAITVLHETAHFFGLDEDDLEARGLD